MEDCVEPLCIDFSFDVEILVYEALKNTISNAIDGAVNTPASQQTIIPKHAMLQNIVSYNMDNLEDSCYMTTGADGTLFLCGAWLLRPVVCDGGSMTMMEYLKSRLSSGGIEFLPGRDGAEFRKSRWSLWSRDGSSYDIPRAAKIDMFKEKEGNEQWGPPPGHVPPFGG